MSPRRRLAAVPDRPARVVLYRRVSALMGRGGDDFHSPDVQLSAMRRATHGLQEIAVIDDIDRPGTNFAREGTDQIRRMARAGQIDAIAVYDVSRFGRDVLESLLVLRELSESGVRVISATEHIDTSTPSGEHMLINLLNVAQLRAREIGRSWAGAIARRAEAGKHHGKPLGYIRRDKRMIPDPVLGPAITEAYRRYAAGDPIGQVTGYLAGLRGVAMANSNVKHLLRSPVYLGKVVADGQILPGEHDPLTDQDTWDRVQQRLDDEAGTPPRTLAHSWSLVGLVECPAGHKLQRQGTRLICGQRRGDTKGGDCAGVGSPLRDPVEAEALRQVAAYAARLRTDAGVRAARLARVDRSRGDRTRLERDVAGTRAAMVRLATAHARDQLPDAVYQEALADLRLAEEAAVAELARLAPAVDAPTPEDEAAMVDQLLLLWPDMTMRERGRALRAVVDRVEVRATDRWRQPESERVFVHFRW
ncbi:recombinase family protein [Micromonospora rubida]